MKRILSLFLIIAMLLTTSACAGRKEPEPTEEPEPTPTTALGQVAAAAGLPEVEHVVSNMVLDEADEAELGELPEVGDSVCGFTVKAIQPYPEAGAKCILFEHEKTGAEFMYVANNDINRVFDLTFFTRAIDDTGVAHVFEHATLDGSKKYPSDDLFFNLMYQTYNTYLNASTGQLYTTYPMASLSEAQLLKYADFYTDSCFNPMLMEDQTIFDEEAWRYRLDSLDSNLIIEGTVYSEMRSAMDISTQAHYDWMRSCFPGATVGNNSGGDPAHIPELTWEEVKEYHEQFYHPSNCIAYLYGKFENYSAFLRLLDEAFAPYEKKEFVFEESEYTPLTKSVEASFPYPVTSDYDTTGSSVIYYSFLCPGLKEYTLDELVLDTLTNHLMSESSPLMKRLKQEFPAGYFGTYIEPSGPDDMIVFYGMYLNRNDAERFRTLVNEALEEVVADGFQQSLIEGLTASLSIAAKLSRESSSSGIELVVGELIPSYAATGNPFYSLNYNAALQLMDDWNQAGLYQQAITDWLLCDDSLTVLTTTYAEPGLREQLDATEASRLAAVKASMSEEDLLRIINSYNSEATGWEKLQNRLSAAGFTPENFESAYNKVIAAANDPSLAVLVEEYGDLENVLKNEKISASMFKQILEELTGPNPTGAAAVLLEDSDELLEEMKVSQEFTRDTAAMVAELQAANVRSLPEEIHTYEVKDEYDDEGIRHLTAEAEVEGIGETLLMLDMASLPQEDLHWFALMYPMLGQLDTSSHTQEELSHLVSRYMFAWNVNYALPVTYQSKDFHPYLNAGFIALDEDMETAYNLAYEILFETQFTDKAKVSDLIERALSSARSGVSYGAYGLMLTRHLGATEPSSAYSSYLSGLDYYAFLNEVSQLMAENPEEVLSKLQEVQNLLHNRYNAITVFAGDSALFEKAASLTDSFLKKLDNTPTQPVSYTFYAPAQREAIIIDSTVQYNAQIASYEDMGLEGYTADLDAVSSIILDAYLIPMLREKYGVYTPMHQYSENGGCYLLTYSDPNITETFDVYSGLDDFLANYEIDQDTLDGYILSSYSYFASPDGELSGAISAVYRRICNVPDTHRIDQMKELKSLTPEKLREYASAYSKMNENGRIFTVGSAAAINEHRDLYDLVLDPLKDFG